jgi:DNA-binding NtrC family response regulator
MEKSQVLSIASQLPGPVPAGFSPGSCRDSPRMVAVLIVDDESLIRWSIAQSLEAEGFSVLEAATAREALACLGQRSDIGVVLLDLKLPDSSDLGLLRMLRHQAPTSRIILMTAHGTADVLEEAVRAGAFRAVGKPFDMDDMVGIVRDALAA